MEYDTKDWKSVVIGVTPSGKAPKKYGEGVYRFSAPLTLSIIMPRRGWKLVKKTKNYVYLLPPYESMPPPFEISIRIPSQKQALEIANSCFDKGDSWMGQIGEWPAWYMHERPQKIYELVPNIDRTEITKKLHFEGHPESSLKIGEFGIWSVELTKTDGEFDFHQHGTVKGSGQGALVSVSLLEGSELSLELTKYERNATARRKCIEHFGPKCQVCNIDFGEVYGEIGVGFIHIHHIYPISEIKEEYEVDPVKDLVPLCPNCHAMVHRANPPYPVGKLKSIYQGNMK